MMNLVKLREMHEMVELWENDDYDAVVWRHFFVWNIMDQIPSGKINPSVTH